MANSEMADLQGYTAAKISEFKTGTTPTTTNGYSSTDNVSAVLPWRLWPKIYDGSLAAARSWNSAFPWTLAAWSPQECLSRRNAATDFLLKRMTGIDSTLIPISTGGPMLLTFDGYANMASGQTCNIGMILNSTAVNNNANPLVSIVANNQGPAFHTEVMFTPYWASVYTTSRGVGIHYFQHTGSLAIQSNARVLGAAAALPTAAITSISLTATFSAVTYTSEIMVCNMGLWKLSVGGYS